MLTDNKMGLKHLFKAALNWTATKAAATPDTKIYHKSHSISLEGKPDLYVSAAKAFKGDPALYNPEDLLLSSLVSCHMMSYLYVCAQHQIDVIAYEDHAEAVLEVNSDGSGRFAEVRLNPRVTITNAEQMELALALHTQANALCFIANSCNFPILHQAICRVA